MFRLNLRSRLFLALECLLGNVVSTSVDFDRQTTSITFAATPNFRQRGRSAGEPEL